MVRSQESWFFSLVMEFIYVLLKLLGNPYVFYANQKLLRSRDFFTREIVHLRFQISWLRTAHTTIFQQRTNNIQTSCNPNIWTITNQKFNCVCERAFPTRRRSRTLSRTLVPSLNTKATRTTTQQQYPMQQQQPPMIGSLMYRFIAPQQRKSRIMPGATTRPGNVRNADHPRISILHSPPSKYSSNWRAEHAQEWELDHYQTHPSTHIYIHTSHPNILAGYSSSKVTTLSIEK